MLEFFVNIIAIIVLGVLFYYSIKYLQHEGFINYQGPDVYFLSESETKRFLQNDYDEYVHTLNQWDLIARKVGSPEDYINKIAKSPMSFTEDQKNRLRVATKEANKFFKTLKIDGINCEDIQGIPWIIALTRGKEYEDGLPHTRGDVILLSTETDLRIPAIIKTLIHEKLHLYQRIYSQDMMSFLEHHGYYRWKQRFGVPRIRSNPDLDPWIYYDPVSKKPMVAYYVSDNPHSITDVTLASPKYEHPYEQLAYVISEKYVYNPQA